MSRNSQSTDRPKPKSKDEAGKAAQSPAHRKSVIWGDAAREDSRKNTKSDVDQNEDCLSLEED